MDRRDGTILTGKLLTPHFAPAALSWVRNNHFCEISLSSFLHIINSSNGLNYSKSISLLGKGSEKKSVFFMVFCQTGGRGVSEGREKTILLFWRRKKLSFREYVHSRTPKTCFTLGFTLFHIYRTALKLSMKVFSWLFFFGTLPFTIAYLCW